MKNLKLHTVLAFSRTLPVTMVKEMMWCEAIPWIVYNYGIEPPYTPSMERGIEVQRNLDLEKIAEKLGLPKPVKTSIYVEDKGLGLHGVIDIVAGSRRLCIAEVKAFKRRIRYSKHFIIQLKTYAVIAYRALGPIEKAYLYMDGIIHRVVVREQTFIEVKHIVEKLWRITLSPEPPQVMRIPEKCSYCRYRRFCSVV